jgi:hypothetical protein
MVAGSEGEPSRLDLAYFAAHERSFRQIQRRDCFEPATLRVHSSTNHRPQVTDDPLRSRSAIVIIESFRADDQPAIGQQRVQQRSVIG